MSLTDLQTIRRHYGLAEWAPIDPLGLYVHRADVTERPLAGWNAVRAQRRTFAARTFSSACWLSGDARVRIECREEGSRQAAFGAVPEALLQFESALITRSNDPSLGEHVFMSPGSVVFHRGNLLLAVTSFSGPPDVHLAVAAAIDALLRTRSTTSPARSSTVLRLRRVAPQQRVALSEEVAMDRGGMVRVFAPDLTVVHGATGPELIAPATGTVDFDVFLDNPVVVRHEQRRWEVHPAEPAGAP
jgi:hypothetical protein